MTNVKNAKTALESLGFEFVCSAMHDGGATNSYGSLFMRGQQKFWVNNQTADFILCQAVAELAA